MNCAFPVANQMKSGRNTVLLRLVQWSDGARALARFNLHCGATLEMPSPPSLRVLKRRGRRAPLAPNAWHAERAFTRLDMMVLIGLVVLLLAWFGLGQFGERGRIAKCAANLKILGQAMQSFGNDHGDALPPASIDPQSITWDAQIAPYLPRNRVKNGIEPSFQCPSDRLAHARARSYSMSAHDMQPGNWPPGPDNATGVGLVWNKANIQRLLGDGAVDTTATNTEILAMVKRSSIPSPADTMVLTEMINSGNNLKDAGMAAINNPGQQSGQLINDKTRIHYGRFNYLMLDGHVELLSPLKTGVASGARNIWSISKTD
jgi:prepilin-type processing-associated H-X9-DG protein